MKPYFILLLAATALVPLAACEKLWISKPPGKRAKWRGNWNMDRSTYLGKEATTVMRSPDGKRVKVNAVLHEQGSYGLTSPTSGTEFYACPLEPRDCLTLTHRVWFEDGFDFAYGGKLPGLFGGGVNCTYGTDPGKDCFTSRFIWRTGGAGGLALFTSQAEQTTEFCTSGNAECNNEWGHRLGSDSFRFETGRWYTLTQTVRLNTPNKSDGYIRLGVVDLKKVYKTKNVMIRTSDIKIDGIFFSNFFGGSSSCSASPVDTKVFFKLFVLKDSFC